MATGNYKTDDRIEIIPEHSVNAQSEDTPLVSPQGCAHCSWKVKLEKFSELKPGDHICIDGRMFRKTLTGRPKTLYNHHAMVAKVEPISTEVHEHMYDRHGKMAAITLIEVNREENSVVKEIYAFDLKLLEIYKVVYDNDERSNAEKLQAAQRHIDVEWDYDLFKNNCEHFCHECCIGVRSSVQAETCCDRYPNVNIICMELAKYIRLALFHMCLATDDAISVYMYKQDKKPMPLVLDIFLSVFVSVIFYLLYYLIFWSCCTNRICCHTCRLKCSTCTRYYLTRCMIKISIWLLFQVGPTIGVVVLIHQTKMKQWTIFLLAFACSVVTVLLVLCVSMCYKHPVRKKSYEKRQIRNTFSEHTNEIA